MRVVVTGGSGQLGALVLRRLMADRAVRSIVSLDVRPPTVVSGKLTAVEADVRDEAALARHLEGAQALVHLAAIVTRKLPRETMDAINVRGSLNAFEAAARAGVERVVYASSAAAYGVVPGHALPVAEDAPRVHQADFAYAAGKHEVEAFLDAFEPAHPGMCIARLRPVLLIGTRMDHPLAAVLRHRVLPYVSDALFPIVWDEDVADAAVLALRLRARGAFNLAADEPLSCRELAKRAGLHAVPMSRGVGEHVVAPLLERAGFDPQDPMWLEVAKVSMSFACERAKRELGWTPRAPTCVDVIARYLAATPRWRLDDAFRSAANARGPGGWLARRARAWFARTAGRGG